MVRLNLTKSFGKRDRFGLPLPGFFLAPPPHWFLRHTQVRHSANINGCGSDKNPPSYNSWSSRQWQRRSKIRSVQPFWILLAKTVEIPEPWGQCSASSTWCLFSTFSSGYVVLRSSAAPDRGRIGSFVSFFEANRLTTSFSKETTNWSVPEKVLKVFLIKNSEYFWMTSPIVYKHVSFTGNASGEEVKTTSFLDI